MSTRTRGALAQSIVIAPEARSLAAVPTSMEQRELVTVVMAAAPCHRVAFKAGGCVLDPQHGCITWYVVNI